MYLMVLRREPKPPTGEREMENQQTCKEAIDAMKANEVKPDEDSVYSPALQEWYRKQDDFEYDQSNTLDVV